MSELDTLGLSVVLGLILAGQFVLCLIAFYVGDAIVHRLDRVIDLLTKEKK